MLWLACTHTEIYTYIRIYIYAIYIYTYNYIFVHVGDTCDIWGLFGGGNVGVGGWDYFQMRTRPDPMSSDYSFLAEGLVGFRVELE